MDDLLDLIQGSCDLAHRARALVGDWSARHSRTAPQAARDFAFLATEIADGMILRCDLFFKQARAGKPPDRDAVMALNQRAKVVTQITATLDHSGQRSLHPVLSPTVQGQLRDLKLEGQVLVTGTRDLSYELWTFTKTYFHGLVRSEVLLKIKWPILLFLVPHPPLDWSLHHVLIYHEIGHAQFQSRKFPVAVPVPSDLSSPAQPAGPASTQQDLFEKFKHRRLIMEYKTVARAWLQEVYSDIFGLVLVGPAFLVAFARVLGGSFPFEDASATHPPIAFRIWLMCTTIKARGFSWGDLPDHARKMLERWEEEASRVQASQNHKISDKRPISAELVRLLVNGVASIINDVVKDVETVVGDRSYKVSDQAHDLERSQHLCTLKIPPIEREDPPTLVGSGEPLPASRIFSISWWAFYRAIEPATNSREASEVSNQIGQALLESLDAAEALRTWKSVQ